MELRLSQVMEMTKNMRSALLLMLGAAPITAVVVASRGAPRSAEEEWLRHRHAMKEASDATPQPRAPLPPASERRYGQVTPERQGVRDVSPQVGGKAQLAPRNLPMEEN